jgi:hypothetical protein
MNNQVPQKKKTKLETPKIGKKIKKGRLVKQEKSFKDEAVEVSIHLKPRRK